MFVAIDFTGSKSNLRLLLRWRGHVAPALKGDLVPALRSPAIVVRAGGIVARSAAADLRVFCMRER